MVITIVNAHDFPGYAANAATAVLRIYDPIDDWQADAALQERLGWGRFAALSFWDYGMMGMGPVQRALVTVLGRFRGLCLAIGEKLFGGEIPWRPFLPADACAIRDFADQLAPAGVQSVLVVCSNGRSRSWTVARWLANHLGIDAPAERGWQRESEAIARTLNRTCPGCCEALRPVPPRACEA